MRKEKREKLIIKYDSAGHPMLTLLHGDNQSSIKITKASPKKGETSEEVLTVGLAEKMLSWKLSGSYTVWNPFVLPCSTNRIAKDLVIINSSLVIGISLQIL